MLNRLTTRLVENLLFILKDIKVGVSLYDYEEKITRLPFKNYNRA